MTYIDADELAVRIAEACMGNARPKGITAREAIEQLLAIDRDTARGFQRAALSVSEYIAECCNAEYPGSVEIRKITVETEATQ